MNNEKITWTETNRRMFRTLHLIGYPGACAFDINPPPRFRFTVGEWRWTMMLWDCVPDRNEAANV